MEVQICFTLKCSSSKLLRWVKFKWEQKIKKIKIKVKQKFPDLHCHLEKCNLFKIRSNKCFKISANYITWKNKLYYFSHGWNWNNLWFLLFSTNCKRTTMFIIIDVHLVHTVYKYLINGNTCTKLLVVYSFIS